MIHGGLNKRLLNDKDKKLRIYMVQFPHARRLISFVMSRGSSNNINHSDANGGGEGGGGDGDENGGGGGGMVMVNGDGNENGNGVAEGEKGKELAMVLDGDGRVDGDDGVGEMSVEELEKVAKVEEERRRKFDEVLEKGWEQWSAEEDKEVLKDALVRVLKELGGGVEEKRVNGFDGAGMRNGDVEGFGIGRKRGREGEVVGDEDEEMNGGEANGIGREGNNGDGANFGERAKYIPMRLTAEERKTLRLVEAALVVSEYTDQVDVLTYSRMKTRNRIHGQIRDICSVLTGLVVASDYKKGQELIKERDFAHNEAYFQRAFEIARRHKVANPEKMRSTYGKLIHMLQDSVNDEIVRLLDFSCVKPMTTVSRFLEDRNGHELLEDSLVDDATREIKPPSKGRSRRLVQQEIRHKERAVELLAKRYSNRKALTSDDVRRCLYSIGDNNAYLRAARDPCDIMIHYLKKYFGGDNVGKDKRSTLAILVGRGGARLTHDHKRQFAYVHQSLTLWREVLHEMYKLWYMAEGDLLSSSNPYALRNTGQGLNRVQSAPSVSRAMNGIIKRVQAKVGSWVGSSVVHLGDHNVPNGLIFLDKYAQVPRILLPITTCIRRLDDVVREDKTIAKYVENNFGGLENARKIILRDFFRHAFDGSGADNFFDAGSCIDGRLTSAWNWCSSLEKKTYYPLFLLTGFVGFDGQW